MKRVGLVGARGYVGGELLQLLRSHPSLQIAFASSRERAGEPVFASEPKLRFEALSPGEVWDQKPDAVVLALPNGTSEPWLQALEAGGRDCVVVDLSADHRFEAGASRGFVYGLPERHREQLRGARRISNPGCYATAIQLALDPLLPLLRGPAHAFGVSGFSGAGTRPSPSNDPELLHDNLLAYAPIDHAHEREASRHLGHAVRFMPHVASWFRGIHLTLAVDLDGAHASRTLQQRFEQRYRDEPLVRVQHEAPQVRACAGTHRVTLGGIASSRSRAVLVACIDNLLKGAATQALQNLNLALRLPEFTGVPV